MGTIFVSPGVFTREQDFTVFASRIGVTRQGLVGKTLKGPAFEPIKIGSTDEFLLRFGSTSVDYPLPYVANSFLSQSSELTVTRILGKGGFNNSSAWLIVASGGTKSGATLAVLRSKKDSNGTELFDQESDVTIGGITTLLSSFVLSGTTGPLTAQTNSAITISLDETREDYIVKTLGQSPKVISGTIDLYVESIFPHFIREAGARSEISNLNTSLVYVDPDTASNIGYKDYTADYTNPITPYIVSRVIGGDVRDLFRFQSISDGDSANKEIKISIQNIDTTNLTFDVLVRRFEDTDATASQTALERWSNLSLDETKPNFIGKIIGTTDENYPRKSMFITVDMADGWISNTVPAGFRGFDLRNLGLSGFTTNNPNIYYKTAYLSADTVFKTYLGISELGYTSFTQNLIGVRNSIKTVEADLFAYQGTITTGLTTIKGFHMESTAPSADFIVGDKTTLTAYTNSTTGLTDKGKLKFTLVPVGGFDGFDKYKSFTNPYEEFTDAQTDNVQAFKDAVDTFANVESTDINVFATPGIDYDNNLTLVNYALDMVESRTDSLYIIDSPRLTEGDVKGTPEEVVSTLESTGIDSNYAATYWPWVQLNDTNLGKFTYQAPTFMVVKALAFTDNTTDPWFAPAGLTRGTASELVQKADIKLTAAQRDTLYQGRVNPIATFSQQGVVIWGQKTLQTRISALDRVNIRRLLLQVRRLVAAASLTLVFEQNDQTLRDQFLSKVEPILLQIQNRRGLAAFKVVMDDSNNTPDTIDRNQLIGKILLKPTFTAEFISIDFSVLPSGANFEDF